MKRFDDYFDINVVFHRPVSFKALYEFVDLHQDGISWPETGSMCSRIFRRPKHSPSSTIAIRSPKNVFFYGRGGNRNLRFVGLIFYNFFNYIKLLLHDS